MTDTSTGDRYADLDEFASQKAQEGQRVVPAFTVQPPPPQLFHGVVQVFTPRNEAEVRAEIRAKAAAAGEDWYYRIPFRNKDGTTTWVEGPSKNLANDVLLIYKYAEVDSWISGEGPDFVEFTARFIDTERGIAMTRVFRQRKGASKVGTDRARNDEITFAIGMSKATRNVICNALQSFCDFAFEEARRSIVDKIGRNLDQYRERTVEKLKAKLDIARVEKVIGRSVSDWLAPDIAQVIARMKGVEEGMATLDETFPPIHQQQQSEPVSTKDQLDQLVGSEERPEKVESSEKAAAETQTSAAADDKPAKKK